MPALDYMNIHGIDVFDNFLQQPLDGQLIFGLNIVNFPNGAITKRPGYTTFLGTPDASQINSLMWYPKQSGTEMYLYRSSGSAFYYSLQGTGAWTIVAGSAGGDVGGTITNNARMQSAILNNVFITGDGGSATMHTSNGTVFTNTSNAPVGQYFMQYHNRIYTTNGTNSTMTYSSYGSADNWAIATPADSSSFTIPGPGAAGPLMMAGDRLVVTKTSGRMLHWDDTSLVDMTTIYGPTMTFSPAEIDGYYFYIHQTGHYGFDGASKQILSNSVQRYFYNRTGSMSGTMFGTAGVGATHLWDYYVTLGTVTDDFTAKTVNNAILKYDYQKDTHLLWQFADNPTSMLSYLDANNNKQFVFGNSSGQAMQLTQSAMNDNGKPIASEAVFLFNFAAQATAFSQTSASGISGSSWQKKWNWLRLFFNPGCEVNVQFSFSDTLTYQHLKWSEILNIKPNASGDFWQESDGVVEVRFPNDSRQLPRSRFLFVRIYDNADNARWTYYGAQVVAEIQTIQ